MAVRQLLDFLRRQVRKEFPRQDAEEGVAQAVDPFEMLEEEDQPLEMGGVELAVNAVKRMGHRMGDLRLLEIGLQLENVVTEGGDIGVLRLRDAPNQQMNFTRILREISRNFFTDKSIWKSAN